MPTIPVPPAATVNVPAAVAGTPSLPGAAGFAPPVSPPAVTCFFSVVDGFGAGFLLALGDAEAEAEGGGGAAADEGSGDTTAATLGTAAAASDLSDFSPHAVNPKVTTSANVNPTRVPSTRAA
ncbi:hypothetical protein GCM10010532_094420 [Dactylosporangium siamense]